MDGTEGHSAHHAGARSFQSRGINVEIREADDRVELTLDGVPISVSVIGGKYHSQLANQFVAFDTIDDVVETLLSNQGRTWTLHGHVCDDTCGPDCHHHEGHEHPAGEGNEGGGEGHTHGPADAPADEGSTDHGHAHGHGHGGAG